MRKKSNSDQQQPPLTGGLNSKPTGSLPQAPGGNQKRPVGRKGKELDAKYQATNVVEEVRGQGIELVCSWYPPIPHEELVRTGLRPKEQKKAAKPGGDGSGSKDESEAGKEVVPFILVHNWGRSRQDMQRFATYLQSQGHAVIVPDLRGHGESTVVKGMNEPLNHEDFKKKQALSAVADIDQCKRFLMKKNNEGELNIDLLNVVAVGDSSHLAIAWAISDWSWPSLGSLKQGQDVKSLILFSPTAKFNGSVLKKLAKSPLISGKKSTPLPMLVLWGNQAADGAAASEFVTELRKHRPVASEEKDMATRWFTQDLFDYAAPTQWNGVQLAGMEQSRELWVFANNFVQQKVMVHKDRFPWRLRGSDAILNK